MASKLVVNKSGSSLPVYDMDDERIGTIYDDEVYILHGETVVKGKAGAGIHFLNSSGNVVWGGIATQDSKYWDRVSEYPYGTATVFGSKRNVFKMRRIENIYTAAGNFWGQVAAGSKVVVDPNVLGDNHREWCKITYVQKSDGTWQKVDGDGYSYGFIDFGLNHGSYNSNISMYGTF